MLEPQVVDVSPSEFKAMLVTGDIVNCVLRSRYVAPTIRWGQRMMLLRMGYSAEAAETFCLYTHSVVVTDPATATGVEAAPPRVGFVEIAKSYPGVVLNILRGADLTPADQLKLRGVMTSYVDYKYDFLQYFAYPWYMALGWAPAIVRHIFDRRSLPVCSELGIRGLQSSGQYPEIDDYLAYPPARLPLLPNIRYIARVRIRAVPETAAQAGNPVRRQWYF